MAAALAFDNQKERPLFPKLETIVATSGRERDSGRDRNRDRDRDRKDRNKDRGVRKEHRGQSGDGQSARSEQRRERDDRPQRELKAKEANANRDGVAMVTYRLEVGNNDKITPSNIVGAIANEADIESRFIGEIKLHDEYSTVDLPEGMPSDLLNHLKKVRVCAKPMRISRLDGDNRMSQKSSKNDDSAPARAPRKRPVESSDNKTLSRNVKNKRTAEPPKPTKPVFRGKGKNDDGEFGNDKKSKRAKGPKIVVDGSAPLTKKKKTYTKKPKRS
jgi:ATP-dependent RNA helicase DeaD